jgi:hypothetical protein
LDKVTGYSAGKRYDRESANMILRELRNVQPPSPNELKFEEAVRLILYDCWSALWANTSLMAETLADSWARGVLARMQGHYQERLRVERERVEFEDPVRVERRRAEKRRLKAEQHAARLERKKERDREWRERDTPGSASL